MSDITKCADQNCPWKDECYRFTFTPGDFQLYFVGTPAEYDSESKFVKCEMYWGDRTNQIMDILESIFQGQYKKTNEPNK